jgi:hypothetical protein
VKPEIVVASVCCGDCTFRDLFRGAPFELVVSFGEGKQDRRVVMKLYVGNIPRLANEDALRKWFERAGLPLKTIDLASKDEDHRFAWVETQNDGFPLKSLRHLSIVAFWGQFLVVRKAGRELDESPAGRSMAGATAGPHAPASGYELGQ